MWIKSIDFSIVWDYFFYMISTLGNKGFLWIGISFLLAVSPKYRKTGFAVIIALAIVTLLGEFGLKPIIGRERPFVEYGFLDMAMVHASGYSLPSGHTSSSFAAAAVLADKFGKHKMMIWMAAVLMGFSRIYFFVHYPSDVFAGAILGLFVGFFITRCTDKNRNAVS